MKVTSPVGEFPFEPIAFTVEGRRLVLKGTMGAWPARVELGPADVVKLSRLLRWPMIGLVAIGVLAFLSRRLKS